MFERLKMAGKVLFSRKSTITSISEIFGGILAGIETQKLCDYESYLDASTRKCWALYKGCDVVSKVIMDTPYALMKKKGGGEAIENKEIATLLASPNKFENGSELFYKTGFHMKATGNAFWLKDQANALGDRPKQLFTLNPKRMKIVFDKTHGIGGYLYKAEGVGIPIPFDVDELLHFRIPHPNNDYWGLGEVEAAEDLIQEFINRQSWGGRFWENGASPSGVLICEDQITDQAKFDEAKAKWKREYGGSKNSGKTAMLTGKWSYQKLGLSNSEMQSVENSKWTVEQIFMQLGVPLSVAGVQGAANYATSREDKLRFRWLTIKPLLKFIEDTLNSDLIEGFDPNLKLTFNISGLEDLEALITAFIPLFDRGGMSINELRVKAGLEAKTDDPIYDQHFITGALGPLELSGVAQGQPAAAAAAQGIIARHIDQALLGTKS